jgi:hypothetical protein
MLYYVQRYCACSTVPSSKYFLIDCSNYYNCCFDIILVTHGVVKSLAVPCWDDSLTVSSNHEYHMRLNAQFKCRMDLKLFQACGISTE